jgi:hypothetical protein
MHIFRRKLFGGIGAFALTGGLMVVGTVTASAATNYTCVGGTVPAGTYRSLTIAGVCSLDGGNVFVEQSVVLRSRAGLNGLFAGSRLSVGQNVSVGAHAILFLGCDPVELPCLNDSTATQGSIVFGSLDSWRAAAVVVHDSTIGGHAAVNGGGAGFACAPLFPGGPPDYTNFAGDAIGGDVTVIGLRTCWDGFNGNVVNGSVTWSENKGSPLTGDANLMDNNFIGQSLRCFNNNPRPHLSDAGSPTLNTVGGRARGQCAALAA